MKIIYLVFLLLIPVNLLGQEKILRPTTEISDPALNQLISKLTDAVKNKDKDYIISILSSDILVSFGGNGGINEFKSKWEWFSDDSDV